MAESKPQAMKMKLIRRCLAIGALFGSLAVLQGCPNSDVNPNAPDDTDPGFVQVMAHLEAPSPPNPRGEFDITSQDVLRKQLAANLVIRITALAGDEQSGIKNIAIESNLTWQCYLGPHPKSIGSTQNAALNFSPPISTPTAATTPWQINVVANPISQISESACGQSAPDKGPINIDGFIRVVATNGAGRQVKSKTFAFQFVDVGRPPNP